MKIIGVTSCPTGIAHSEMAAESLESAAEDRDLDIKVEVRGSMGAENELTDEDIEEADVLILATDISVPTERFGEMERIKVGVQDAVTDPDDVIDRAIAVAEGEKEGDLGEEGGDASTADDTDTSKDGSGGKGFMDRLREILAP